MHHPEGKSHCREGLLLLAVGLLVGWLTASMNAEEAGGEPAISERESVEERLKERSTTGLLGVHVSWDDGLHVVGGFEQVQPHLGGTNRRASVLSSCMNRNMGWR